MKNPKTYSNNNIHITFDDVSPRGETAVFDFDNRNDYFMIDLEKIWNNNTLVKSCYVSGEFYIELKQFCNLTDNQVNSGGFIFGRHHKLQNTGREQYNITFEKLFIPNHIELQDKQKIKFGLHALLELDSELSKNSELGLIGWFHTKPRFVPVLSNYDLNIQGGSFRNMWQVAMVIDPKFKGNLVGLFTWNSGTKMNNFKNETANSKYIIWNELKTGQYSESFSKILDTSVAKNTVEEDLSALIKENIVRKIDITLSNNWNFDKDLLLENYKIYGDLYIQKTKAVDKDQYTVEVYPFEANKENKRKDMLYYGIAVKTMLDEKDIFEKLKLIYSKYLYKYSQVILVYYQKNNKTVVYKTDDKNRLRAYNNDNFLNV